jgi:hypothetical protein
VITVLGLRTKGLLETEAAMLAALASGCSG